MIDVGTRGCGLLLGDQFVENAVVRDRGELIPFLGAAAGDAQGLAGGIEDDFITEADAHAELFLLGAELGVGVLEKAFGATYPGLIEPLYHLGGVERELGNYVMAENYFSRAIEINVKNFGEDSLQTADRMRMAASVPEKQGMYGKAELCVIFMIGEESRRSRSLAGIERREFWRNWKV